jgi:hypothetical protein
MCSKEFYSNVAKHATDNKNWFFANKELIETLAEGAPDFQAILNEALAIVKSKAGSKEYETIGVFWNGSSGYYEDSNGNPVGRTLKPVQRVTTVKGWKNEVIPEIVTKQVYIGDGWRFCLTAQLKS